ncbi:hypothetical protein M0R88_05915 [Halorussus gelatinilyticus]|uniref:Uncharacterized protein n=1 Tax=Halorussus gelatinilyticus TaxID=2937524 RepID=A0A8U0ILV2_9EURY|nr:hypothetical protein [Halorussus gelatinilyticus]UPW01635.1 hypothetical protein M0R88_05915 [Halorussus gelatinilyticus]
MSIGPFSAGAVLGSIATLVGAGTPLYYRYVRGAKSHISLSRLETIEDSEWRDGRVDGNDRWSRRILIRASNNGWRDGVIRDVVLNQVILSDSSGQSIVDSPESGVEKIELEHFDRSGEKTRLTLQQRTNYGGQIVGGRDDELLAIIPFILQDSDLGKSMKHADRGTFSFSLQIEDNKRIYWTTIEATTSLEDSAGGDLQTPNDSA